MLRQQQGTLTTALSGFGPALERIAAAYQAEWARQLPRSIVRWLTGPRARSVTLRATDEAVLVSQWSGHRGLSEKSIPLATWLQDLGRAPLARARVEIGISIPRREFLVRKLIVPNEALQSMDSLLSGELERQTPMRASDVVQTHIVTDTRAGTRKAAIEHWIIRKEIVEAYADQLGVPIEQLSFAAPFDMPQAGQVGPRLYLRPMPRRGRGAKWLFLALTCSALTMFGLTVAENTQRLDSESKKLTSQITMMSERALAVRQQADDGTREHGLVAGLYRQKSETPGLLDVWDEVTRLLPDGTYVTELRLTESKLGEWLVHLNGFSNAATSLVSLLDRSPLFAETTLTSAITPDPQEQRDRFSVQSRLMRRGAK